MKVIEPIPNPLPPNDKKNAIIAEKDIKFIKSLMYLFLYIKIERIEVNNNIIPATDDSMLINQTVTSSLPSMKMDA
jgi:hypothetical protein